MNQQLNDEQEILFRQISPSWWVDNGQLSSQSFRPTKKDNNKLSVDRSTKTTAKDSYIRFTYEGYSSAAVFGVTVQEFRIEDLDCFDNPLETNNAHAFADFSKHGNTMQKNISKKLAAKANARGCLHKPE